MIVSIIVMVNLITITLVAQVSGVPSLVSGEVEMFISSKRSISVFRKPLQLEVFNTLPVQVTAAEMITFTHGVASGDVTTKSAGL